MNVQKRDFYLSSKFFFKYFIFNNINFVFEISFHNSKREKKSNIILESQILCNRHTHKKNQILNKGLFKYVFHFFFFIFMFEYIKSRLNIKNNNKKGLQLNLINIKEKNNILKQNT